VRCHPTCLSCVDNGPNHCLTCHENANIRESANGVGYCDCKSGYTATPDSRKCEFECHEDCGTCKGPGHGDCLTCKEGFRLSGRAPCGCENRECHSSCATCTGGTEYDCLSCHDNADLHGTDRSSYCECRTGYSIVDDLYGCIETHGTARYHEFVFDCCKKDWESNGVTLLGESLENDWHYP
jgi:proprotein convertase subtilisin/kexin type 5